MVGQMRPDLASEVKRAEAVELRAWNHGSRVPAEPRVEGYPTFGVGYLNCLLDCFGSINTVHRGALT